MNKNNNNNKISEARIILYLNKAPKEKRALAYEELAINYFYLENFLIFVIEQAVAVTGKIRVCNLLPEFFTDALILLRPFQSAGAIATGPFQTFPNRPDHLFIFIQSDSHHLTSSLHPL